MVIVLGQNIVGFHRGSSLVPHTHGQPGGLSELVRELPAQLRPDALGAVHVLGQTDHDLPHLIFLCQTDDVGDGLLRIAAGHHRGGTDQRT